MKGINNQNSLFFSPRPSRFADPCVFIFGSASRFRVTQDIPLSTYFDFSLYLLNVTINVYLKLCFELIFQLILIMSRLASFNQSLKYFFNVLFFNCKVILKRPLHRSGNITYKYTAFQLVNYVSSLSHFDNFRQIIKR